MTLVALKLTLSPAMIALASLLARRFGPAVGGWLIGLPVTAGPVALVLDLEHGSAFAARLATGFVAGVSAQAAFVLGYVALARRGSNRPAALASGSLSYALVGVGLEQAHLAVPLLVACALAFLVVGLWLVPSAPIPLRRNPTRRDLWLRVLAASCLVLAVTTFASTLGAGLSGVVTTFPLLSTILALSVHRDEARAAIAVYRGLLVGLFALVGFATTLAVILARLPLAAAFGLAVALTLSIQLGSLQALRRSVAVAT